MTAKTISLECPKCLGSRVFTCWQHIANGVCFTCRGTGRVVYPAWKLLPPEPPKVEPGLPSSWLDKLQANGASPAEEEAIKRAGAQASQVARMRVLRTMPASCPVEDVCAALEESR